jgi:multidrug efflux pump subunit AcrA (membrane-fusion protein)
MNNVVKRAITVRRCAAIGRIALTGLAAALFGLAAGCDRSRSIAAPPARDANASAPEVRIVNPQRQTVTRRIEQPGFNIEAFEETALYARITGYVRKWNKDIGDPVAKGDLLAELYVPEMEVDLQQKEAGVQKALADIDQVRAAKLIAEAQVTRGKLQSERLAKLGKGGGLDPDSVEEARLGYESAKAALEKAKADIEAAKAQAEVVKANRDYARTMLTYAKIKAPYDGVVTQRNVSTDDLVQLAGAGPRGQPLFVVSQLDPVRVFVNIPGSEAAWIKDGDPVSLLLQGAGGEIIHGKVTRNAHALNPQSRTLKIEIDLPNPADKNGRRTLLPGMYVQAGITVRHTQVWTLPDAAVRTVGDQTFCFRIVKDNAMRTPLQVGLRGGGLVEVLQMQMPPAVDGAAGDWVQPSGQEEVAASDLDALSDGQAIRRKKEGK